MTGAEIFSPYTDFLYARPSFLEGMSRILDYFGTLQRYNTSSSSEASDLRAFYADWMAVGEDMHLILERYAEVSLRLQDIEADLEKKQALLQEIEKVLETLRLQELALD